MLLPSDLPCVPVSTNPFRFHPERSEKGGYFVPTLEFQRTRSGFILNGEQLPKQTHQRPVSTNPFRFHPERSTLRQSRGGVRAVSTNPFRFHPERFVHQPDVVRLRRFQRTRSGFILNGCSSSAGSTPTRVSTNPFRFHPERSPLSLYVLRVGDCFNEPVQVSS